MKEKTDKKDNELSPIRQIFHILLTIAFLIFYVLFFVKMILLF